jgi:hypothetical protein
VKLKGRGFEGKAEQAITQDLNTANHTKKKKKRKYKLAA